MGDCRPIRRALVCGGLRKTRRQMLNAESGGMLLASFYVLIFKCFQTIPALQIDRRAYEDFDL